MKQRECKNNKNKNENATIISSDLYNNKIEKYKSKNKAGYELEKEENVLLKNLIKDKFMKRIEI